MPAKPPPARDSALVAGGETIPVPPSTVERATTVRQISRACEVDRPLIPGDPRWLDLSPARGDHAARKLLRRFEDKPARDPLHILFASHRGAGKSTELMLLQSHLPPRYHCLYFRVESKHREEIKNELKKFPGSLLDSVNLLLDAAAQQLAGQELLILIDNLDRYPPAVVDALLVRNGDRIRQLHCNLLLTPPIGLLYRPHSEQIDTYFPCEVMNTVRLRRPDQAYDAFDGRGRDLLLAALDLRMDLATLLPDNRAYPTQEAETPRPGQRQRLVEHVGRRCP